MVEGEKMRRWGVFILEKLKQKVSSWHVGCSRAGQETLMPLWDHNWNVLSSSDKIYFVRILFYFDKRLNPNCHAWRKEMLERCKGEQERKNRRFQPNWRTWGSWNREKEKRASLPGCLTSRCSAGREIHWLGKAVRHPGSHHGWPGVILTL